MRIPLFVTASGVLITVALGFAWTFRRLSATYERPYVRTWTWTWLYLAAYGGFAGLAVLAAEVPALQPFRLLASLLSMLSAWLHLRSLLDGTHALCCPDRPQAAWPRIAITGAVAAAVTLALVPVERGTALAFSLYLSRLVVLALAWALAYGIAGVQLLRQPSTAAVLGRSTLLLSLLMYAALRLAEPAAFFVDAAPVLAQFLTFGGLPMLVGVGAGMLITLLEVEHSLVLRETGARSAAEQSATASEAALAAALSTSSDPVLIVDREGLLVAANPAFFDLLTQLTGMRVRPGIPIVDVMDAPTRAFWEAIVPRVLAGEAVVTRKRFAFPGQDAPRAFATRFTPVREGGRIIGVLAVAHDTTEEERLRGELAHREEWFRSLIENASDMIFQVTGEAVIEYASPSVWRLLGYDHTALIGRSGFEFMHPDDVPTVADALRRSLAHDDTVPTVVPVRVRHAQGEYLPLEGVSRPYVDRDGGERLIVALRDVRERQRLEHELTGARRLEAIGRLAGGVAHDFNNLLTAVAGNVTLLKLKAAEQPGLPEHLDEIEQSVQRGAELTRRLLAFARQQVIEPRTLHIAAQLLELDRLLRRLLGDQILFDMDLPPGLWSIRADPTAFEQILVNLAVNARDAMPRGGTFRITARNLAIGASGHESLNLAKGEWLRLDVEDTGTGIPHALLERIFEPFFTTKESSGGTGLGLATVYGAVTQMGGQIRVDSVEGRGTTFSLFFPRVVAPSEASVAPQKAPLPRALPGETILLMEDEAPVRDVTAKLLRRLGYEVIAAEDGETGVELAAAREGPIALVISDIVMPGIHGDTACARIRERRPDVPVLFISGFSLEALRWQHGMPAGAKLLSKPYSLDDLAHAVRQMIALPAAR